MFVSNFQFLQRRIATATSPQTFRQILSLASVATARRITDIRSTLATGIGIVLAGTIMTAFTPTQDGFSSPADGLIFAAAPNPAAGTAMTMREATRLIGWPARNIELSGRLKIGMIDGGININHPALIGQDIRTRDFRVNKTLGIPLDHGTAVAALLVGNARSRDFAGLLPHATLYAANIFSIDERGRKVGDPQGLVAATEWLIEAGVTVINLSVTGRDSPMLRQAVELARAHDVLIVAAAGNNRRVRGFDFPAAYAGTFSATAIDRNLQVYDRASLGDHVDFAAPGVFLALAANHGGQVRSGTSFAAPFLTAAVAVAAHQARESSAHAVLASIAADARDLGHRGTDRVFGRGLLDCDDHGGRGHSGGAHHG